MTKRSVVSSKKTESKVVNEQSQSAPWAESVVEALDSAIYRCSELTVQISSGGDSLKERDPLKMSEGSSFVPRVVLLLQFVKQMSEYLAANAKTLEDSLECLNSGDLDCLLPAESDVSNDATKDARWPEAVIADLFMRVAHYRNVVYKYVPEPSSGEKLPKDADSDTAALPAMLRARTLIDKMNTALTQINGLNGLLASYKDVLDSRNVEACDSASKD